MNLSQSYLDLPYEKKWEHLKTTIVQRYLGDNATLPQLAQSMVDDFRFKAEYVTFMSQVGNGSYRDLASSARIYRG